MNDPLIDFAMFTIGDHLFTLGAIEAIKFDAKNNAVVILKSGNCVTINNMTCDQVLKRIDEVMNFDTDRT